MSLDKVIQVQKDGVTVVCYVQPKASKNMVVGFLNDQLKIKIQSPPVDGKANKELIKLFSKSLKIAASKISIKSGELSRHKVVFIQGEPKDIVEKLKKSLMVII